MHFFGNAISIRLDYSILGNDKNRQKQKNLFNKIIRIRCIFAIYFWDTILISICLILCNTIDYIDKNLVFVGSPKRTGLQVWHKTGLSSKTSLMCG